MMNKVFVALVTSSSKYGVESIPYAFSTFDKATEFLHEEYLDIKAEHCEDDITWKTDDIQNLTDEKSVSFELESNDDNYWYSGIIYGLMVK